MAPLRRIDRPGRARANGAMLTEFLLSAATTILVILDPPGLAAIFIAVTQGMNEEQRRQVATRACLIAFIILAAVALGGSKLLQTLGISLPAFRITGGLLLFAIAFEMVFEMRSGRKKAQAKDAITIDMVRNIAAFPLAIPILAGPGAMTAIVLLAGRTDRDPVLLGFLLLVLLAAILVCLAVLLLAGPISRMLGVTGNVVLSRLLGLILAALAVQFVIDGVLAIIRAQAAVQ